MHSVDILEEALALAQKSGFEIRTEFLGESIGGACRIGSKWLLYVDLRLPVGEQLEQVVEALRITGIVRPDATTSQPLKDLLST